MAEGRAVARLAAGGLVEPHSVPQSSPCNGPWWDLAPLHRCSTWASSCLPTCPWCHSLFARHYFYQNFREVLVHSSPGIYLGLLMSRQHQSCQALPAREAQTGTAWGLLLAPGRLGTAGWLSSWGLLTSPRAGGARHCTVGPMVVVVSMGRPWDGGKHRGSSACQGARRYQQ